MFLVERMVDLGRGNSGIDPAEIRRNELRAPRPVPVPDPVALAYDTGNYEPALDRALEWWTTRNFARNRSACVEQVTVPRRRALDLHRSLRPGAVAVAGQLGAQAGLYESADRAGLPRHQVSVYTGSTRTGRATRPRSRRSWPTSLGIAIDASTSSTAIPSACSSGWAPTAAAAPRRRVRDRRWPRQDDREEQAHRGAHARGRARRHRAHGRPLPRARLARTGQGVRRHQPRRLSRAQLCPPASSPAGDELLRSPNFTYPFGTHIAVVEIGPRHRAVKLLRYVAVDDVGNVINPMIVDGQLHGGIAQGVGRRCGKAPVTTAAASSHWLADGLRAAAGTEPGLVRARPHGDPVPVNPLGVKGVGEAGAIASPAAVVNAVMDALPHLGVRHIDMPLQPEKVWRAMQRRDETCDGGGSGGRYGRFATCIRHHSTITAPPASRGARRSWPR